jgi:lincosamide nucleotidyltransferase
VVVQEALIAKVRELCLADERLDAALMYGSFPSGEADAYSDVEFWLFFDPRRRAEIEPRAWCAQIAPLVHHVRNEFSADVVMFPGLVRGEFHFATTNDIAAVRSWPARGAAIDRMIVLDRTGRLRPALQALPERAAIPATAGEVEQLCGRFANWLVLAHHVACRGEILRAWDALGHASRHLLWMARLATDRTGHWLTPSRCAERELPPDTIAELRGTNCADSGDVATAVRSAWQCGRRYWTELAQRHGTAVPDRLFLEIDDALSRCVRQPIETTE